MEKIYTLRVKREEAELLRKLLINNKEYLESEIDVADTGADLHNNLMEYYTTDCLLNEVDAMSRGN